MMETLLMMGGSATAGFIFKLIANAQKSKADHQKMLLEAHSQSEKSRDSADKRGGVWMRRFTVFVMLTLFAVIALGIGATPTNIIESVPDTSFFWGLMSYSHEDIIHQVEGAVMDDTLRASVLSIISFLFGADVGETK